MSRGEAAGSGDRAPEAGAVAALRLLAESGLIAVVTATMAGITEANGAFLRLTGYSEADLAAGLDLLAMTPPEWAPADQAALAELRATGRCAPFRKEYLRADGSRVSVEVAAVLLDREPLRLTYFIRDASAELQAKEAAQQASELAALAAELSQALTVADVAQALGGWLRRAVGAKLAILIERTEGSGMSEQDDADVIEQAPRQVGFLAVPRLSALRGAVGAWHRRMVVIAAACALLVTAVTLATVRLTQSPRTDPALARLITEVTTVPVGTSMPGWPALADPASPDGAYWAMLTISPDTRQPMSGPPLTRDGKPEVLYAGTEYCPYCAMESWPLIVALSRFGTFSGLATSRSSRFDQIAPIDGWTFYGSRYTSRYLSFVPVERYSNVLVSATANPDAGTSYRVLQRFTPAQRAIFRNYDKSRATPFLDFANHSVQIGSDSPLSPRLLAGKSWAQLAAALRRPKTPLGAALLDEADLLTAQLCAVTGDRPAAACPDFLQHVEFAS